MTHWRLFLLPEGPFLKYQFITKETAIVFLKNNLFFRDTTVELRILVVPDEASFVPEGYFEIEKCLLELVEVE